MSSLSQQQSPASAQTSSHQHPVPACPPHLPEHVPARHGDEPLPRLGRVGGGLSIALLLIQPRDESEQKWSLSQQQSCLSSHISLHQQSSADPPPHRPLQEPELRQVDEGRVLRSVYFMEGSGVEVGRIISVCVEDFKLVFLVATHPVGDSWQNCSLSPVSNIAPVFMACLGFLVGVAAYIFLSSSLDTTLLSYLALHCLPDQKQWHTTLTISDTISQLEIDQG